MSAVGRAQGFYGHHPGRWICTWATACSWIRCILISNVCIDVFHNGLHYTLTPRQPRRAAWWAGAHRGVRGGWADPETETFVKHLVALLGVAVGAFGLSYGLFAVVNALIPMRVTEHQEKRGLDDSQHGEKMS